MAGMLDLYDECRSRGLNVVGLKGWREWQVGYYFRRNGWDPGTALSPPQCFINHHTATSEYTGNVKNSQGLSKANIWLGLGRPGTSRLYSTGRGTPRADFAVRWAANYGNGACDRTVYDRYVLRDRVAPNRPDGGDDGYANKLAIGMEIVHPGTGGLLDPGVFELACQINAAANDVFGWPSNLARILDHRSSTRRKQDVNFQQSEDGYTINAMRTRIAEIINGDPPPPQEDEMFNLPYAQADKYHKHDVEFLQLVVAAALGEVWTAGSTMPPLQAVGINVEERGVWGPATVAAIKAAKVAGSSGTKLGPREWAGLVRLARQNGAMFI